MPEQPLVSIVIPTYNRAHLIGETLDSVLNQTYPNWECLIVDDGSTDKTEDIVKCYTLRDSRFQFYNRPKDRPKGANACRNYGLELSVGAYINWVDSDDVLAGNKLELQVKSLLKSNAKVHVGQSCFFFQKPGDINTLWSERIITKRDSICDSLILDNVRWQTGAVLWSRSVIENEWDERLQAAQEWHFHIIESLTKPIDNFYFTDERVMYIRNSNDSITRNTSDVSRYTSYLYARLFLLEFLKNEHSDLFDKYFKSIYSFTMRYVKILISNNKFEVLKDYGNILNRVSGVMRLKFYFGILIYKLFKRDFFLKRVV